jgi:hypothetical protein
MTHTVTGLAIMGLVASLAACSAGVTSTATSPPPTTTSISPSPIVTSTMPTPASTSIESAIASLEDCFTILSPGLLVSSWSLVEASRGRSDHEERLEHFQKDVGDWLDGHGKTSCQGDPELARLNFDASLLALSVSTGSATDADYEKVRQSGDAWLDAVDYTDHRFGDRL